MAEDDPQPLLTDGLIIFEWAPGVPILYGEQQVPEGLEECLEFYEANDEATLLKRT